jgi:hypothetical protein
MIYVHSKGIICGSANIDQCSVHGSPDTEMAVKGLPTPTHMGL